jgi:hypothetical protein
MSFPGHESDDGNSETCGESLGTGLLGLKLRKSSKQERHERMVEYSGTFLDFSATTINTVTRLDLYVKHINLGDIYSNGQIP